MRRVTIPLVLALLVLAGACGDDDGDQAATTTTVASDPTTTTAPPPAEQAEVLVYFAREDAVATAGRQVEAPAVAQGALVALLEGPDELEQGIGMTTAIPAGTELLGVDIANGAATVDLSAAFATEPGGSSMEVGVAQVVFTMTQFPSVNTVSIEVDGEAVETDLDRGDVEDATPFILVESPVPGATVSSPIEVSGIANTFEATVVYEVVDSNGATVDEGFTTASAGTGVWGDFSFETIVTTEAAEVTLVVFQESAEDGSRTDVYEVPLLLE